MKKLTSLVTLISLLSLVLALAGCGKPAADSKDNKQETVQEREDSAGDQEDIESSEQVADSEDPATDEEDVESSEEKADQSEEPESDPAEAPADSEEASSDVATPSGFTYPNAIQDLLADENGAKVYNTMKERSGYTDDQIELLCACVKESVINNYLTPNSLAAEDIKWPTCEVSEDGTETWDSTGWGYLAAVNRRDEMGGDPNEQVVPDEVMPDEQMCKLMDSVYEGFVTWRNLTSEEKPLRGMSPEKIFPALDYSTE